MILIDSNVLIDILDRDPNWFDWSFDNLELAAVAGRLVINPIVVAEVAPQYGELDDFLAKMAGMGIAFEALGAGAAFHAGRAFRDHLRARPAGIPKAIIADFLIGGHAQSIDASILTRDPRFYRSYFPAVPLITPQ